MGDGADGLLRLAVDIGGTFTDLVAFDEGRDTLIFGKSLTTHGALVNGIESAAHDAGASFSDVHLFLHGSTIVINTLLERTGAKTALLITEGFRDIYEIGRINRPDAYNLYFEKHDPLVPRSLRFEIEERLRADGAIHRELNEQAARATARSLRDKGVKAVAMELEVRLPSTPKTADNEVAKRCVDILKWNVWTSETIQVKVEHGWVTLTGSVDWAYQKQAAERAIHALSGVRGVSNLIAIKPAIHPEDVRSTIEKAFLRNAELESGQIRVKANAGQIVLEGNVKTWHERQIAEQAAWSAPGVTSVDDRIRVS